MKPFPEDEGPGHPPGGPLPGAEPLSSSTGGIFIVGLVSYAAGFLLLARDHPDSAPFVIVGGILLMMWAFLI